MHRRTQLGAAATLVGAMMAISAPAAAQVNPQLDSGGPDSGAFVALFIVAAIVSVGVSIWKFAAIRDMGMRRGMSRKDASTAAFFSQDRVTSAMVLKPEQRRRPLRRRSKPEPQQVSTIEDRLAKVDALRESGAITADEAASRRDEILDEI